MVLLMLSINSLLKKKLNCLLLLLQKKKFKLIYKIKNNFKKGITPLLCALTIFNICGINVSAATYNINLNFVEPSIPEYGGYINVYGDYGYGNAIKTFYIAFYPYDYEAELNASGSNDVLFRAVHVDLEILDSGVSFYVSCQDNYPGVSCGGMVILYSIALDGEIRVLANRYVDQSSPFSYTYGYTHIEAYQPKGNFTSIYAVDPDHGLNVVWGDDLRLFNAVSLIASYVQSINSTLTPSFNSVNQNLINIYNRLGILLDQDPEGSISDVSSSGITSVENKENALVGSNASTSELNVSINPNAASVVWNLVDDVVTRNAKVFTMFISILTIAVIGLILNR